MIVLDTNVISEMTKQVPSIAVSNWLDAQPFEALFITSVTIAEIGFGIMAMPEGKRRIFLQNALDRTEQLYAGRILPFDQLAVRRYAELATFAKAQGRGFPTPDGYIAAIADAHSFIVATRDTGPFKAAGMAVIDPWQAGN